MYYVQGALIISCASFAYNNRNLDYMMLRRLCRLLALVVSDFFVLAVVSYRRPAPDVKGVLSVWKELCPELKMMPKCNTRAKVVICDLSPNSSTQNFFRFLKADPPSSAVLSGSSLSNPLPYPTKLSSW